ncbi:MAG: cache domain-containing protein, partial [Helicobacter sp.]|nr:cache domain-containing protein [Helicobacter sp.]
MSFYQNLPLRVKTIIFVLSAFISYTVLIILLFLSVSKIEESISFNVKDILQAEIEQKIKLSTDTLAESLGATIKGLDEKEQIAIIANAIEKFRFEDDSSGYYFAYKEHTPVAHPTRKDLIGKSLYDTTDKKGVYYVRELYKTSQNQSGRGQFVYFIFTKPLPDGTLVDAEKVGYAQKIPNTDNIWISTGVYVDTLEAYISNDVHKLTLNIGNIIITALIIAAVIFVILFFPTMFLFYSGLMRGIKSLKHNIVAFFKYLNYETKDINLRPYRFKDEFGELSTLVSKNVDQIQLGLEKDNVAITQAAATAKAVEEGDLT